MKTIGIIPARGGSKGIPRKNIAQVAGRPLIAWTIDACKAATRLTRWFVSTEDEEIAAIARACGAPVEMRPECLAEDDTPTVAVLAWHIQRIPEAEAVMTLQPTCPLRTGEDIDAAIVELKRRPNHDSLVTLVPAADHPEQLVVVNGERCVPYMMGGEFVPRQRLQALYARSGDIYLTRASLIRQGRMHGNAWFPMLLPAERRCNVNEAADLERAEVMLNGRK